MSAAGLWNFFVTIVGLAIVVALIFAAMRFRALPESFKRFAKLGVGGAAVLILLAAIGSVLFGGGGGIQLKVTPGSILEFVIGVIVLYGVLWLCDLAIDLAQGWFASEAEGGAKAVNFAEPAKFILTFVALVIILVLAEKALLGGGLGFINFGNFGKQTEFGIPFHVAVAGGYMPAMLR